MAFTKIKLIEKSLVLLQLENYCMCASTKIKPSFIRCSTKISASNITRYAVLPEIIIKINIFW